MTEPLAGSALMKEASKCSETLQEYRSGYENPVGEVSDPDLKKISLDMRNTEKWGIPLSSKSSQADVEDWVVITPQENPQNDDGAPANKTQLMKCPILLLIG